MRASLYFHNELHFLLFYAALTKISRHFISSSITNTKRSDWHIQPHENVLQAAGFAEHLIFFHDALSLTATGSSLSRTPARFLKSSLLRRFYFLTTEHAVVSCHQPCCLIEITLATEARVFTPDAIKNIIKNI